MTSKTPAEALEAAIENPKWLNLAEPDDGIETSHAAMMIKEALAAHWTKCECYKETQAYGEFLEAKALDGSLGGLDFVLQLVAGAEAFNVIKDNLENGLFGGRVVMPSGSTVSLSKSVFENDVWGESNAIIYGFLPTHKGKGRQFAGAKVWLRYSEIHKFCKDTRAAQGQHNIGSQYVPAKDWIANHEGQDVKKAWREYRYLPNRDKKIVFEAFWREGRGNRGRGRPSKMPKD